MEWSEETIVRLRDLWAEGHSTAEIGRRLGVSKNAIVGKAHRLDLAARPSPIRRDGSGQTTPRRAAPRRIEGPTLPPLASTTTPTNPTTDRMGGSAPGSLVRQGDHTGRAERPVQRAIPASPPKVQAAPAPRPYGRIVTCCWPLGEPGTRSFRFCDEQSEPGKPYCTEHARLAYVKVRDRRDDAA
ncbi:MAG TPA: GcrA family cell cycle regulator [Acetobacteraceae bacterium]|nr:GcrA family cell cycle regulator [Acetobacteraceae bacterium]